MILSFENEFSVIVSYFKNIEVQNVNKLVFVYTCRFRRFDIFVLFSIF